MSNMKKKLLGKQKNEHLLRLLLPVTHCADHNTDLTSNINISKMVRVNSVFTRTSFKVHAFLYKLRFFQTSLSVA